MEAKPAILYRKTIKPSYPTPTHLKDYKLSYFNQMFIDVYIPFVLFYSASDINSHKTNFSSLCEILKTSLSDVLTLYYPFCGRAKGNASIECNDAGVLYTKARAPFRLTEILQHPKVNVLKQFLPFDPHEPGVEDCINGEKVMMAVQVTELNCGAVGVGVCVSHLIADLTSISTFLNSWVATAKGSDNITKPHMVMEASKIFPPSDTKFSYPVIPNKDIVGIRLVFDGKSLSKLKAEMEGFNPTKVEAVTAFIWKLLIDLAKESSGEKKYVGSFISHVVNIRSRLEPPLPEHSIGNFVYSLFTSTLEFHEDQKIELRDLAMKVRDTIRDFVAGDINKLAGDGGIDVHMGSIKNAISMAMKGNRGMGFTSWTRFFLYEADFGWGKPTWACPICLPLKDAVVFFPTKGGEGIEAWVNLSNQDLVKFERYPELLQYDVSLLY